jgi:hypothetical protein
MKDMNTDEKKDLKRKTLYINNPSSFLDTLLSEDNADKAKVHQYAPEQSKKNFFSRNIGWFLFLLGAVLLAGFIWRAVSTSPEYTLKKLIREGHYSQCLAVANAMLIKEPYNKTLQSLGAEALLKGVLKNGWADLLNNLSFADARVILENSAEKISHNPEGVKLLQVLNWLTDVEEYFAEKSPGMSIVIFRDEIRIEWLLQGWDMNKEDIRRVLQKISAHDDSESLQKRIYLCLDRLQAQKVLYFGVIQEFKHAIQKKLEADRPAELLLSIDEFKHNYPEIQGIEAIEADSAKYIQLWHAVKSEQWNEVRSMADKFQFHTAPFIAKVHQLLNSGEEFRKGKIRFHLSEEISGRMYQIESL